MELIYLGVLLWNLFTWECYCGSYLPESVIVELDYLRVLLWWNLFTWECYCGTCLPKSVIVELIPGSVIVELVYLRV